MEAIKIDINKEYIDVPTHNPRYEEMRYGGINRMVREGEIPYEMVSESRITYEHIEVYHPEEGVQHYFVRLDDRKIFNDLIHVSNGFLERVKAEAYEAGRTDGYYKGNTDGISKGADMTMAAFAKMPWYKRLFKRF